MVKVCRNLAANIAESLGQLYCISAAMFTRGLFFAKGCYYFRLMTYLILNPGRFAPDPVRPLDVSPQRRFAPGRFAPGRFAPLVVSPLVDSPQEENSTYFVEIYVNS